MLRIGDFSQLGQVSVRTPRLYDELGLLKPARIDRFTGYRYYSIDQLPLLNRILMLKDLGFSLDQIGGLLKGNLPADQMRELLMAKRAEIEQELEESKARLERVATRLRQIEPNGPELVIYHTAEYTDQDIDTEVAVVVDRTSLKASAPPTAAIGQVTVRELPAVQTMASVIHQGHPQDVGQAMTALFYWIGQNNLSSSGSYREIHLYGRELELVHCDPVVIELQIPVGGNAI